MKEKKLSIFLNILLISFGKYSKSPSCIKITSFNFVYFIPSRIAEPLPSFFFFKITVILFFILPRFGINPVALFQTIAAKIIPFLSMIRGIIS